MLACCRPLFACVVWASERSLPCVLPSNISGLELLRVTIPIYHTASRHCVAWENPRNKYQAPESGSTGSSNRARLRCLSKPKVWTAAACKSFPKQGPVGHDLVVRGSHCSDSGQQSHTYRATLCVIAPRSPRVRYMYVHCCCYRARSSILLVAVRKNHRFTPPASSKGLEGDSRRIISMV